MSTPLWSNPRGQNLLDGFAPFYSVYQCLGGSQVAIGCLEPKFFKVFISGLNLSKEEQTWFLLNQMVTKNWKEMRKRLALILIQKSGSEWESHFLGSDGCVSLVVNVKDLPQSTYHRERGSMLGSLPKPAPRLLSPQDYSPLPLQDKVEKDGFCSRNETPKVGQDTESLLRLGLNVNSSLWESWIRQGVVGVRNQDPPILSKL